MPDWFTDHAPAAPAPPPAKGFFARLLDWNNLKKLPGALVDDAPDLMRTAAAPLWEGPSRAASQVADFMGVGHYGSPEGDLIRGAGDLVSSLTSPLSIATTGIGELAGPAARAIGGLPLGAAAEDGAAAARTMTPAQVAKMVMRPADVAMDAAAADGPMAPLPMVNGERQFTRSNPTFERAAQTQGAELAGLDPNPPPPRAASDIIGNDFFRRATAAPADVPPPPPGPSEPFTTHGFGQNVLTTGDPIFEDLGAQPAPLEFSGDTGQMDLPIANNGSGESAASLEALNRQAAMRANGEQFVKYDRAGGRTPLIGPDAVDYVPARGETYGVEGPGGFRLLEDNGGRTPQLPAAPGPSFSSGGMDAGMDAEPVDLTHAEPIDSLERLLKGEPQAASSTAPPDVALSPNSPIPPVQKLYDELIPKWQAAKAAGKDVPFSASGDIETFPEFYQRVVGEPSNRFGAERRVMKPFDKAYNDAQAAARPTSAAGHPAMSDAMTALEQLIKGEEGSLDVSALTPENLSKAEQATQRWRFGGMLSGPMSHVRNIAQNTGNLAGFDLENLVGRALGKEAKPSALRELMTPDSLGVLRDEFRQPTAGTDKYSQQMSGVLGIPSRAMHAEDQMFQQALTRSGAATPEQAEELLYNRSPQTRLGQKFVDLTSNPIARLKIPFSRVGTNILEQSIQRTPGLGLIAEMVSKGALKTSAEKQIVGSLVAAGAGAAGALQDDPRQPMNPIAALMLGSYALPALMAHGAVTAFRKPDSTIWSSIKSGLGTIQPMIPGLSGFNRDVSSVPSDLVASMVPNVLRDAGQLLTGVDPSTLDNESGKRFLGPAIAKIPWLNTAVLHPKRGAKGAPGQPFHGWFADHAPAAGAPAGDWFSQHAPGR